MSTSPNIIRVIKSTRMRWAGHVARMGRGEVHTGFWCGNMRERDHVEDPGLDGRIILRLILRKWDGRGCTRIGSIWLRMGQMAGTCEYGNKPPGSIKCEEFLD